MAQSEADLKRVSEALVHIAQIWGPLDVSWGRYDLRVNRQGVVLVDERVPAVDVHPNPDFRAAFNCAMQQ